MKVMTHYIALVDGKPGAYGVVFPDAPGCTAMGNTYEEALRRAVLALSEWVGQDVPPIARSIGELRDDEEVKEQLYEGSVFAMVPLLQEKGRPVKANLSIDAGLLEAIDDAAAKAGLTRSAFLSSAARDKIIESV
jgi:predicted RNase H-like HicB family nuclease